MSFPFDCVFFDIDDTLFDRKGAQVGAARLISERFRETFGSVDPYTVGQAFLESDRISTEQLEFSTSPWDFRVQRSCIFLDLLGLPHDRAEEIARAYVELYPRIDAPVAHAVSVVRKLRNRCRMGVISNGLPDIQYRKLEALGIRNLFACVVLSQEAGVEKPDPAIFRKACEDADVAPDRCLHVGDNAEADVEGAMGAGLTGCWYNPEGLPWPGTSVPPDLEIRDLRELTDA